MGNYGNFLKGFGTMFIVFLVVFIGTTVWSTLANPINLVKTGTYILEVVALLVGAINYWVFYRKCESHRQHKIGAAASEYIKKRKIKSSVIEVLATVVLIISAIILGFFEIFGRPDYIAVCAIFEILLECVLVFGCEYFFMPDRF